VLQLSSVNRPQTNRAGNVVPARDLSELLGVRGPRRGCHQERHRGRRRADGLGHRAGVRADRPQRDRGGAEQGGPGQDPEEHRDERAAGGQEGVQGETRGRREVRVRHAVPDQHVDEPAGRGARLRFGSGGHR